VDELLAGLGAAARLFGELEDALRAAAPVMVELDTPGAFRFLTETGPLLAGAGFGRAAARLGPQGAARAEAHHQVPGRRPARRSPGPGSASATWVDFRYDVAVADQVLDPAELAELARLKVPLVRLRGQWWSWMRRTCRPR